MTWTQKPAIRIALLIMVVLMLGYLPAREFLKTTFMLGIPFIFTLGYLHKKRRYSTTWVLSAILLLGIISVYGYMIYRLPERIAIRSIISEGGSLVAEGKYDEAINKYSYLEILGKKDKMDVKISEATKERQANEMLEQAVSLIEDESFEQARDIILAIPEGTRAAKEAAKLLK